MKPCIYAKGCNDFNYCGVFNTANCLFYSSDLYAS